MDPSNEIPISSVIFNFIIAIYFRHIQMNLCLLPQKKHNSVWCRIVWIKWKTSKEIMFWTKSPPSALFSLRKTLAKVRSLKKETCPACSHKENWKLAALRWLRRALGRKERIPICPGWNYIVGFEQMRSTRPPGCFVLLFHREAAQRDYQTIREVSLIYALFCHKKGRGTFFLVGAV